MTTPSFILEDTLKTKAEKVDFLHLHKNDLVIMDLTSFDINYFFSNFPQLVAAVSTKLNLTDKSEVVIKREHEKVISLLLSKGITPFEVKCNEGYFYLPRILSTIVNEAFYALEEGVASSEDIDSAMKFGVNYPQGPFRWVRGRENFVITLLDNLYESTGNKRYLASSKLRQSLTL